MRKWIREFVNAICSVLTFPFWGSILIVGEKRSSGLFSTSAQWLSLIPGSLGVWLRRSFYRMTLEVCGADFSIGFLSWIAHRNSSTGKNIYVGAHCVLGMVELSDHVLIGSNVHILSGRHQHNTADPSRPVNEQGGTFSKTMIGQNVWIGNCAVVMADVGENSIVGAGSVVVKAIAPNVVVAENPARILKSHDLGQSIETLNKA